MSGRHATRLSNALLLTGAVYVAYRNLRQWRRDREAATELRSRVPERPIFTSTPPVSVLVAAWNADEDVVGLIDSFRRVDYAAKELVLAAGGAHRCDDLAVASGPDVRLIQHPGGGKQRALARCLEVATGDIVFLTDADCRLSSDDFRRLLAPIVRGEEAVVTGIDAPVEEQHTRGFVVQQWSVRAYHQHWTPSYVTGLLGRNCALLRSALVTAGGFDADVATGTDLYLAKRLLAADYRIHFVRDSAVETRYPRSVQAYWRQQARWLRNLVIHDRNFGDKEKAIDSLRTSVIGLALLALSVSLPLTKQKGIFVLVLPILHIYLSRLRYLSFIAASGRVSLRPSFITGAFLQMYIDFIAWARPLAEYPVARWRNRW